MSWLSDNLGLRSGDGKGGTSKEGFDWSGWLGDAFTSYGEARYQDSLNRRNAYDMADYNWNVALQKYALDKEEYDRRRDLDITEFNRVWEKNRKEEERLWNRNNLYNSPKEQMRRLEEAGLNPRLMYSSVTTGTVGGTQRAELESAKAEGADVDIGGAGLKGLDSSKFYNLLGKLGMYIDLKKKKSEQRILEYNADLIKMKKDMTERDNEMIKDAGMFSDASQLEKSLYTRSIKAKDLKDKVVNIIERSNRNELWEYLKKMWSMRNTPADKELLIRLARKKNRGEFLSYEERMILKTGLVSRKSKYYKENR